MKKMEDKKESNPIKELFVKNKGSMDVILREIFLKNFGEDYTDTNYWFPSFTFNNNYNDQFKHALNECENDLLIFFSYFPYQKDFSFPLLQYIRDIMFASACWRLFDFKNKEEFYLKEKILFIIIKILDIRLIRHNF